MKNWFNRIISGREPEKPKPLVPEADPVHIQTAQAIAEAAQVFQKSVDGVLTLTDASIAITATMDKTILALVSKAINHVVLVSNIYKHNEQVDGHIDNLESRIKQQTQSVSQSSSAIEEMFTNIKSVSAILGENAGDMDTLLSASELGKEGIRKVMDIMKGLVDNSEVLLSASKMIQSIAQQTNLLSMNAAIEAAHAGNVGLGFAVVADEIRKLAESSSTQGKSIAKMLSGLKEQISLATSLTGQSQENFTHIVALIEKVRNQELVIKNAMSEQEIGNSQILEATHQIQDITLEIENRAKQIAASSSHLLTEVKEADTETAEMSKHINDLMGSVEDVSEAVRHIAEDVARLREKKEKEGKGGKYAI